ncbi:30S ribosomal protein S17 [candidate division WOR-3 bacterium JGI_Cruoil_03_44_89]|uniref:Small ribosomal subunit protein uS17 n=1 Tax=candidate division WOR-3 bacterium JGI_Cruoil_03_44_89 TaxID=1973748 RepID=A0A235BVA9_UNCW3|nr:MAG: 30S ribosomal protein S17 [candidate division WOR-3 bacterium JGI_Cruoil_03_44_89]
MKRRFLGEIISDRMDRSRIVKVELRKRHPLLGKVVKKYIKVMCHDDKNETHIGDCVVIEQTRPLSKRKHFRIVEVKK